MEKQREKLFGEISGKPLVNTYYRAYARIDLDAVEENVENMRQKLKPGTKMILVIKTDGYGHGAVEIAHLLEDRPYVLGFAVATLEEGISLRRHGIQKMILVLGASFAQQYELFLEYGITPAIFTYESAKQLSETAALMGRTAKVHIKLDTGMGRIGFLPCEESVREIVKIAALPNLECEGVFTHFARADESDKSHAQRQIQIFTDFVEQLREQGVTFPYVHISNSAGIMELPEADFDVVRAGITIYGLYPSDEVNPQALRLKPALGLFSQVVYVKEVPAGTGIGYGGTFVTERATKVATVPVGYGDGYPRLLSNKGYVLLKGQKAPILGRVCMDQFMVDVTDIDGVENGTPVTLIGKDGDAVITVEELGRLCGRFNYEFVCNIGRRIPRVFYYKGRLVAKKDDFA